MRLIGDLKGDLRSSAVGVLRFISRGDNGDIGCAILTECCLRNGLDIVEVLSLATAGSNVNNAKCQDHQNRISSSSILVRSMDTHESHHELTILEFHCANGMSFPRQPEAFFVYLGLRILLKLQGCNQLSFPFSESPITQQYLLCDDLNRMNFSSSSP